MKNKWQMAFLLNATFSAFLVCVIIYIVLDNAVSQTYGKEGYESLRNNCNNLAAMYPKGGDQKDVLAQLRQTFPKAFIAEEPSVLNMDGLKFIFDANKKLKEVDPEGMYHLNP